MPSLLSYKVKSIFIMRLVRERNSIEFKEYPRPYLQDVELHAKMKTAREYAYSRNRNLLLVDFLD